MTNSTRMQKAARLPEKLHFPDEEKKILKYWQEIKAFETSLKQSKGKPKFTFYDGPPFATGLPHYGHILTGTLKDVVTRYAQQHGFHVERRFGWDTHGLPVEFEIDKLFNIKSPEDVKKMGIKQYNSECKKIVMKYSHEWEEVTMRIGRWIDFKNDYKTLYPWYMESIWWVFKQLYQKGLVYRGSKVMPYSTGCATPLSNFESNQNYKSVTDPAITVGLPLINDPDNAALLIWTTTPWTLPSNIAVCVNPTLVYVRMQQVSTRKLYILLEARILDIFKDTDYVILNKFLGKELQGLCYEPVFPYYKDIVTQNAFLVLADNYVTSESGTGVVHLAPYFGEDDYRVCLEAGIISNEMEPVCPLDSSGHFIKPVCDFEGQYFKDADINIIAYLKINQRLVHQTQIQHSYPFCWRSDTPLVFRAVPCWFIRVEPMRQELLKATAKTNWVPGVIKEKRFGNWLKDAKDWAVSRNRYWGTPIPLWTSPSGDEVQCIGSISELEELSGKKLTDIHREYVDTIEIASVKEGSLPLTRVPEIFDCWFESGCMPFAQQHYPFNKPGEFKDNFPADFIAEGIDQTRGWFYTLTVISSALFGIAPYKNVIVSGLVLAEDGQKMSKRKKNYPDPMEVVDKFGADALRLYLISSPVVKAENLSFKEEGIKQVTKDILLPWYNACRFLMQIIEVGADKNQIYFKIENAHVNSKNIMDSWILSLTHFLLQYVEEEMKNYRLYNIVPKIKQFMSSLTNWYIRLNRRRFRNEISQVDCQTALSTLHTVLFIVTKIMAPYVPFMSENMYQYMKPLTQEQAASVHFVMYPKSTNSMLQPKIERAMSRMKAVIELGRVIRDKTCLPLKYPLPEVVIIHREFQYIQDILSLQEYIVSELNVQKISTSNDKNQYGIIQKLEPRNQILATKLKDKFKTVTQKISTLTENEIEELISKGYKDICGHHIEIENVRLVFKLENSDKYELSSNNEVLVLMNIKPDATMKDEGIAKEVIHFIQRLRKKAHLIPTDKISVFYASDGDLCRVITVHKEFIQEAIKVPLYALDQISTVKEIIIEDTHTINNSNLNILLTKT